MFKETFVKKQQLLNNKYQNTDSFVSQQTYCFIVKPQIYQALVSMISLLLIKLTTSTHIFIRNTSNEFIKSLLN